MFSEVNTEKPNWMRNGIRNLFAVLDKAIYGLLGIAYQIFFNIASADIFSSGTITKFSQRIQLVIGVFVMFQLAMTIIRGIINPDSFTDSKSGAGNIVFRIATALVMLTLVVPINLSTVHNEYERKVSNSGLLFGTLYSLQYRVLKNNTIGLLIMGTTEDETNYVTSSNSLDLSKMSNQFVTSILRGFYRINLAENYKEVEGKEPAMTASNRMCDIYDDDLQKYLSKDATPSDVIDTVDIKCSTTSGKRYAFNYMPLVSLIIGILFTLIILSFCVDVATRAIKLGILQLIAPIPIISYMDPKGGKDGAFNSWIKLVISTYVDLFIRVASVYFAIFVIQEMLGNGISMVQGGIIGVFTRIFIYVALFYFAKEAPKFIKQALGIKDDGGGGLFSGLGKVMGVGATALGAVGAMRTGARASRLADEEADRANGTATANRLRNRGKHLLAGISGGLVGGYTGWNAASGAKDHQGRAAFDAIAARNAKTLSAGRSGGTFFGAVRSDVGQMLTGESEFGGLEAGWKAREAVLKDRELVLKRNKDNNAHRQSIMNRAKSKATDSSYTTGTYNGITANYRNFHSAYEAAINNGVGVHTQYIDAAGNTITEAQYEALDAAQQANYQENSWFDYNNQRINMSDALDIDMGLLDANTANFYEQVVLYEQTNGQQGHNDASIAADRAAYHTATGQNLEDAYDGPDGLKASFGDQNAVNTSESDDINRQRAEINNERMSYESQRAESNANRFRNGK